MHDDLVRRAFTAGAPNRLWLTDITEHPTGEGKLYMCAIKDAFSGRIVGYSIDHRMKASLAVAALRNAIGLRGPMGTVVHSDRGSQFRSAKFVRALREASLVGSMGRPGTCADNAAMESFFSLLQKNVVKFNVTGATADVVTGSVRIVPTNGTASPVAVAIFSYTRNGVRVSEASRLPSAERFKDAGRVLITTRTTCAWGALGHAVAAYDAALTYSQQREQFGFLGCLRQNVRF